MSENDETDLTEDELAEMWGDGEFVELVSIEPLAEAVHEAYLATCERLGWPVKPENQVPYADLAEDSKELDRASVRAVLVALPSCGLRVVQA